jgi:aldose 1-epimerase
MGCALSVALWAGTSAAGESATTARTEQTVFGHTRSGEAVPLYTLTNAKGMQVAITSWGATVVSIKVPDRSGMLGDVVLGFDSLAGYQGDEPYFGATIGRYANRIGKGRFTLNGHEYALARNNGDNHLHGGTAGFDKRLWTAHELHGRSGQAVEFTYTSADGEEGYPGTLKATVTFTLDDRNELRIDYAATSDKPTVVNLTNHSYFNLAGHGDVLGHSVMIKASRFTPVDAGLIPTGELRSVKGTPFDFTTPHTVGERVDANYDQLHLGTGLGMGYDHNWVLNGPSGTLRLVARVSEPTSGRVLEVLTTEPGLQFYTGNFLDGTLTGKGGQRIPYRGALCLETQHFPDSPNKPSFPSTTLNPGQDYHTSTIFRFSLQH